MTEPMTPEEFADLVHDDECTLADEAIANYRLWYAIYEQGQCRYNADKAAAKEAGRRLTETEAEYALRGQPGFE